MRDRHPALRRRIEFEPPFHTLLFDGVFYAPRGGSPFEFRPLLDGIRVLPLASALPDLLAVLR